MPLRHVFPHRARGNGRSGPAGRAADRGLEWLWRGGTLGVLRGYRRHDSPGAEAARSRIEAETLADPAELWQRCFPSWRPTLRAVAGPRAHDLWGKKLGRPTYRVWGLELNRIPRAITRWASTPWKTRSRYSMSSQGWPIYKIKLGTPDDLKIVRELRRHTAATFRVDANCAWTVEQTIGNSPRTEIAGRGVHRAAARGRRLGRDEAGLRRIGPAGDGR